MAALGVFFCVREMRVREGIGKPRIWGKFFGGNIGAILFVRGPKVFFLLIFSVVDNIWILDKIFK